MKLVFAAIVVAGLGATSGPVALRPQSTNQSTLADLLQQYIAGDADVAVRALASWPEARVFAEDRSQEFERSQMAGPTDEDGWQAATLAMLHTEAGVLNQRFGFPSGGTGSGRFPFETHSAAAIRLVKIAGKRAGSSPRLRTFCEEWLIFASSLAARTQGNLNAPFVDAAPPWFADTAAADLLRGSLAEVSIGPLTTEGHFHNWTGDPVWEQAVSTVHGLLSNRYRAKAETHLKRALERDPSLAEARLRLGRIRYLFGDNRAAQPLLERALADARAQGDRFTAVMAALFLGQLHQHRRQDVQAERAYRLAVSLEPRAHPPAVGLTHVLQAQGRTAEALEAMDALWKAADPADGSWNPWALYQEAQFHGSRERIERLRQMVAGHHGYQRLPTVPFPFLPRRPSAARPPALLGGAAVANPVQTPAPPPKGYRGFVDGVRIDVTVMRGNEPVTGLTARDFVVVDKGNAQPISSAVTVPFLSMALVLAVSQPSEAFLKQEVLPVARAAIAAIKPGDVVSILEVGESVTLRLRESTAATEVQRSLDSVAARRLEHTALRDGIYAGTNLAGRGEGRPVVLVISDEDTTWHATGGGRETGSWLRQAEMVNTLKGLGTTVDAVWVRYPKDVFPFEQGVPYRIDGVWGRWPGDELIKTAGKVFRTVEPDLAGRLKTRLAQLRSGYVITYTPTGVKRDGGWHNVEVRLADPSRGRVIQSRAGYVSR
jgi:hypothetical protein